MALVILLLRPKPATPFIGDAGGFEYIAGSRFTGKPILDFTLPIFGRIRIPDTAVKPEDFDAESMMGLIFVQGTVRKWPDVPRWTFEDAEDVPARSIGGGIVCPKIYGKNAVTATLSAYGKKVEVRLLPTGAPPPVRKPVDLPWLPAGTQVRLVPGWNRSPSLPVRCEAKMIRGGPVFIGVTRSDIDPAQGYIDQHVPLSKEQPTATIWADLSARTTEQLRVQIPEVRTIEGSVSWTTPLRQSAFPLFGSPEEHNLSIRDATGKVIGYGVVYTAEDGNYLEESAYIPPATSMTMVRFKLGGAIFGYGLAGELVPSTHYIPRPYRVKMPSIPNGEKFEFQTLSEYDELTINLNTLFR